MRNRDVLILKADEVEAVLAGRELEVIETVAAAYKAHAAGTSSLPRSLFLRFPDDERNRIIALPAYLGDGFDVAGMKWVSSFPGNLAKGLDRASAVTILNSSETGLPEVIMEGSLISAKRTAASAALAARSLHDGRPIGQVGLVGCGPINFEVVRFLSVVFPDIGGLTLFDLDERRAGRFGARCAEMYPGRRVSVAPDAGAALAGADLISIATTAVRPHIFDLSMCAPGCTILHVSLRDISPEALLSEDNIVDDVEHVCCAQTSAHLAEQLVGNRDFIRCILADILNGEARPKPDAEMVTIFSPFGLGVLDIALGKLVSGLAAERNSGTVIESFLPASYNGQP